MRYRISPSKLETFRLYKTESLYGAITYDRLVSTILGMETTSEKARFGSAVHKLIEYGPHQFYNPLKGKYAVVQDGGVISFREHEVKPIKDFLDLYKGMSHELWASINIHGLYDNECLMNMRLDGLHGNVVHDHKVKLVEERDFYEAIYKMKTGIYENSLQWKIYLAATGAKSFQYNIFIFVVNGKNTSCHRQSFVLYPYKGMKDEIVSTLKEFIAFCKAEGLEQHILHEKNKRS